MSWFAYESPWLVRSRKLPKLWSDIPVVGGKYGSYELTPGAVLVGENQSRSADVRGTVDKSDEMLGHVVAGCMAALDT